MKWISGMIVGGVLASVAACSSSPSGVSSGVDGSKTGDKITKDEAKKICEANNSYSASKISTDLSCRGVGLSAATALYFTGSFTGMTPADADLQAACKKAADDCVEKSKDSTDTTDPCASVDAKAGCTATVTEMESCLTALVDASVAALNEVPACDTITADSFKSTGEVEKSEQPAACDSVPAECGFGTKPSDDGLGGAGGGAG